MIIYLMYNLYIFVRRHHFLVPSLNHNNESCFKEYPALRKHAYSNILKILTPKKKRFSDKNSDILQISAQNIDCGYSLEPHRRGGSNEYPQSMF